jgi:hypothetical protein
MNKQLFLTIYFMAVNFTRTEAMEKKPWQLSKAPGLFCRLPPKIIAHIFMFVKEKESDKHFELRSYMKAPLEVDYQQFLDSRCPQDPCVVFSQNKQIMAINYGLPRKTIAHEALIVCTKDNLLNQCILLGIHGSQIAISNDGTYFAGSIEIAACDPIRLEIVDLINNKRHVMPKPPEEEHIPSRLNPSTLKSGLHFNAAITKLDWIELPFNKRKTLILKNVLHSKSLSEYFAAICVCKKWRKIGKSKTI